MCPDCSDSEICRSAVAFLRACEQIRSFGSLNREFQCRPAASMALLLCGFLLTQRGA
jgi:hypothetical protein